MMLSILFNSPTAYLAGLGVLAFFWLVTKQIHHTTVRRVIRVGLVFLGLPFIYIGHPLVIGSMWMFLVNAIAEKDYVSVFIILLAGLAFIGIIECFRRPYLALKKKADDYANSRRQGASS